MAGLLHDLFGSIKIIILYSTRKLFCMLFICWKFLWCTFHNIHNNSLHSMYYICFHRDLKMENILLDKKKRNLKIIGKPVKRFEVPYLPEVENVL